jgi:hypothetical protein
MDEIPGNLRNLMSQEFQHCLVLQLIEVKAHLIQFDSKESDC